MTKSSIGIWVARAVLLFVAFLFCAATWQSSQMNKMPIRQWSSAVKLQAELNAIK